MALVLETFFCFFVSFNHRGKILTTTIVEFMTSHLPNQSSKELRFAATFDYGHPATDHHASTLVISSK